jgi:hypothetical protein
MRTRHRKKIRSRLVFVCAAFILLIVPACGGGSGRDIATPLREFLQAAAESDAERAASYVCTEFRDQVRNAVQDFGAFTSYGSQLDIKVEFIDLQFEVTQQADTEASVVLTDGQVKVTANNGTFEQPIEGIGRSFQVTQEDGRWLLCEPMY